MKTIIEFWAQAGWFVIPLFVVSLASWFWLISLYIRLQQNAFKTSQYEVEMTERLIKGENKRSIIGWMAKQRGLVPDIINYVFAGDKVKNMADVEGRYDEATLAELSIINREFSVLGALIKAAPLLGLLGTVSGMIETFGALDSVASMDKMSSGIAKALLTTQLGLIIALPGVFGLVYLKRKLARLVIELGRLRFHINSLSQEYI